MEKLMTNTQRLLSCVFQNRADEAIAILRKGDFDRGILDDVGLTEVPLPLYRITECFAILLDDDDWSPSYMPTVLENRRECHRLLEFWHNEFGYPVEEMDFRPYQEICAHFDDVWDFEDLMDGTPEELVKMGYDLDEAMLCFSVLTYRRNIIDEQIAKGTNPDVTITGDYPLGKCPPCEGYNALVMANTIYCDVFDCYDFGWTFDRDRDLQPIERQDVKDLLEAAAYRQLYVRLKELDERIKKG